MEKVKQFREYLKSVKFLRVTQYEYKDLGLNLIGSEEDGLDAYEILERGSPKKSPHDQRYYCKFCEDTIMCPPDTNDIDQQLIIHFRENHSIEDIVNEV